MGRGTQMGKSDNLLAEERTQKSPKQLFSSISVDSGTPVGVAVGRKCVKGVSFGYLGAT